MSQTTYNVLVLCTGNSARSILGEALFNHLGQGRIRARSAGSHPSGKVNPLALETLEKHGVPFPEARSKSWFEFATPGAPGIDCIFTVCARAAGETCPVWVGHPTTAHWDIPDPAHVEPMVARVEAFEIACEQLQRRIKAFLVLPLETMSAIDITAAAKRIHEEATAREQGAVAAIPFSRRPVEVELDRTPRMRTGLVTEILGQLRFRQIVDPRLRSTHHSTGSARKAVQAGEFRPWGAIVPTIISHVAAPLAIGLGLGSKAISLRLLVAGIAASMLPDLDVLAFRYGIAYSDQFGHRGLSHSLLFAAIVAAIACMFSARLRASRVVAFAFTFFACASHGLLDMLTNGGLGVALFWPFSDQRFFFPEQVIQVSPLSLRRFLGPAGLQVLKSEFLWIWAPAFAAALALVLVAALVRRRNAPSQETHIK
ncbi:hypothetical protein B566_EDAN005832 [Ephemera danica]|nr:hypothetical protein B566_EDAN005832 [Ephemera danica]